MENTVKIIFLDIDEVLNGDEFLNNIEDFKDHILIDPKNVEILNHLIKDTGSKIVLTSARRKSFYSFGEIQDYFKLIGIKGECIDITPCFHYEKFEVPRGVEIQYWLEKNRKYTNYKYVILDDSSDMLYDQRNNFVQTSNDLGLTIEDYNKSLKILNE